MPSETAGATPQRNTADSFCTRSLALQGVLAWEGARGSGEDAWARRGRVGDLGQGGEDPARESHGYRWVHHRIFSRTGAASVSSLLFKGNHPMPQRCAVQPVLLALALFMHHTAA